GRLVVLQRQEFLAEDRHVTGGLDAEADLAAVDVHDGDADVVADDDLFAELTTEDQHVATLLRARLWVSSCRILSYEPDRHPVPGNVFPQEDPPPRYAVPIPKLPPAQPRPLPRP